MSFLPGWWGRHGALIASAALLCLFASCETTPGPGRQRISGGFTAARADGAVVARANNFVFPKRVGQFERTGLQVYDAAGRDLSAKYEAGRLAVVDVYVYPQKGLSLGGEVQNREAEIKLAHPDARLRSEQPVTIRPTGQVHRGRKSIFTFAQNFRSDIPGPYKSQLLLFTAGNFFIKYRATYPAKNAERAEQEFEQFLNSLPWPR